MRGRKPLPPTLRLLSGNQGKRGVSKEIRDSVKATLAAGGTVKSTVGPSPDCLSESQRAVWDRVAVDAVWLDASNRELLEAYCRASVLMRDDPDKFRTAAMLVRSLAAEMGLSATARARLNTGPGGKTKASDLPPELTNATAKPAGA